MNRDEIKQYLPHREPMLLVDEMTLDENHVAHSKYHVTGEEFFLQAISRANPSCQASSFARSWPRVAPC